MLSKHYGHLLRKETVNKDTFLTRIRTAIIAREGIMAAIKKKASDIISIARISALQIVGFDEAIG